MKRIITGLIVLGMSTLTKAQNFNPFVAQCMVSPSPLNDVASNGTGILSFIVGNSGDDSLFLIANQEMMITITLSSGEPNDIVPINALGGSFVSMFNWMYDPISKSYLGTQNQTIPDALNGGTGTITIRFKVTSNSIQAGPQNGFNVNVTPPAYTNGVNSVNDDQVSSYTWTESPFIPVPDFDATLVNTTVTGNVGTNDFIAIGATYTNITALAGNPGNCIPSLSPNGNYSFVCPTDGEYNFNVHVCETSPSTVCRWVPLVITVIDSIVTTNNPIANSDVATTLQGNPVDINVVQNDQCFNGSGCTLTNPVIIAGPSSNGSIAVVNIDGSINFKPDPNFVGRDTIRYMICDNQTPIQKCDTDYVYVTVLGNGSPNSTNAADDYAHGVMNNPITGNTSTNDQDPEGNNVTITPQSTTISGVGTFELLSNGIFTFTPVSGFDGPVSFPYTLCDNGSPLACANATIHLLVLPPLAIPLPVKINYFTSTPIPCGANLTWRTQSEKNTSHFTILRKASKETSFTAIAKINAAGNSETQKDYTYTDADLQGDQYDYKIETTDIDQNITLSDIRSVRVQCVQQGVSIYPNPASGILNVCMYSDQEKSVYIRLRDMSGRILFSTRAQIKRGIETVQLSVEDIASGMYNLSVIDEVETKYIPVNIRR